MKPKVSLSRFINMLSFKPKYIGYDSYDDVYTLEFSGRGGFSPSLEFNNHTNDAGTQHMYYEIIDFNGYNDGDMISMTSSRRNDCIQMSAKNENDVEKFIKLVDESLKKLYDLNTKRDQRQGD